MIVQADTVVVRESEVFDRASIEVLFEMFCQQSNSAFNREDFWDLLPWGYPGYKFWVLEVNLEVRGFMDGVPMVSSVSPFLTGIVQFLYVDPDFVTYSPRLIRRGLKHAKKIGVETIQMSVPLVNAGFWTDHGFHIKLVQVERRVQSCQQH